MPTGNAVGATVGDGVAVGVVEGVGLGDGVGVDIDRVVINAMVAPPFPRGLDDLDQRLARLARDLVLPGLPNAGVLAGCASHLRSRAALNTH